MTTEKLITVVTVEDGIIDQIDVFTCLKKAENYAIKQANNCMKNESGKAFETFEEVNAYQYSITQKYEVKLIDATLHTKKLAEVSFEITDEITEKTKQVTVKTGSHGLYFSVEGFGNTVCDTGEVVLIDYFDGKTSIKVWADCEKEDFTHSIDLKKAETRIDKAGGVDVKNNKC